MKIQIQYHFYFDRELPVTDGPLALRIECGGYDAYVSGWDRSEPLFYSEIGQTLSSMKIELSPVAGTGQIAKYVVQECIDRLRVVLEWAAPDEFSATADDAAMWLDRAVEVGNFVLDHLRVCAASPTVIRIPRYWKPGHSLFALQVPYTESWINTDDGSLIPLFGGANSQASSGAIVSPFTGTVTLSSLAASISGGRPPALYRALLVDAEEALTRLGAREAVLSAASAIEARVGLHLDSLDVKPPRGLGRGESFAERNFHLVTKLSADRSLKQDDPETFDRIESLYRQRNSLMHEGRFDEAHRALPELALHQTVLSWIAAARSAIEWMDLLSS